jgi:hypothetical protein
VYKREQRERLGWLIMRVQRRQVRRHTMAKEDDRQTLEEKPRKRHKFEQEVLAYLKEHGPQPYNGLYVLFDRHSTAEIQSISHGLKQGKLIQIGEDSYQMVSLTASGLKRLEETS